MSEPNDPSIADAPRAYTQAELEAIIRNALSQQQATHDAQINALQDQVTTLSQSVAGTTPSMVTTHGAGPYTESRETWSLYDQERAWLAHEAKLAEERISA